MPASRWTAPVLRVGGRERSRLAHAGLMADLTSDAAGTGQKARRGRCVEPPPSNVERIAAMTRSAITHDDRGIDRTPTCRGDWDDWVSASSTRSHVLGDPLLDWLDRHGPAKGCRPGTSIRSHWGHRTRIDG